MTATMSDQGDANVTPLPAPRRPRRMQASMYLALLAGLLAVVGTLVYTRNTNEVQVAVSARPLVAGEIVREDDVRFENVSVAGSVAGTLIKRTQTSELVGRQAARGIGAGALITRADLTEPGQQVQLRSMSIPIDPTRAAGGSLARGDVVDVIDSSGLAPVYVVVNARVLSAGSGEGVTRLGASNADYAVTVSVDETAALRLAAAITADKVDVVRSTGAVPVAPSSPPTTVRR